MFKERFEKRLKAQRSAGLYRNPPLVTERDGKYLTADGEKMLSFAGNDYLGLSGTEDFRRAVSASFEKYPSSSSSSRLVSGNHTVIGEAERCYAKHFGYDEAIFFPSGYQANLAVLSTLFDREDTVYFDKHVHASSVKGIGMSGARFRGYNHNSISHLAKKLEKDTQPQAPVITESLFSMDGDLLEMEGFARLKEQHNFLSVVDEAHAFGALGEKGRGIARDVADVAVGTFGKALGLFGAMALMPKGFREYLVNFASPLIYTTSLPEAHAAASIELLAIIAEADERRARLAQVSTHMREKLSAAGFHTGGAAHIVAVTIGDEKLSVDVSRSLFEKGFFVFPARFPTVPLGQAILRVGMTALHDENDIAIFVEALKRSHSECAKKN